MLVQNDIDALVTINMPGPLDHPRRSCGFTPSIRSGVTAPFWGKAKVNIVDVCQVNAWLIADETCHACHPAHVDADQQYFLRPNNRFASGSRRLKSVAIDSDSFQRRVAGCALERVDIVREAISKSIIVHVADDAALEFSNDYITEHLILHIKDSDAAAVVTHVQNLGSVTSVFVGSFPGEVSHLVSGSLTRH